MPQVWNLFNIQVYNYVYNNFLSLINQLFPFLETFRIITKAYKVLTGNESKALFDYYLDHPRDYFKVSGHHYIRAVPKSNVFIG